MTTDTAGRLNRAEEAIVESLALKLSPGIALGTICTRLAYFRIVDDYLSIHTIITSLVQQQYVAVSHQHDCNWYILTDIGRQYYDSYLNPPG